MLIFYFWTSKTCLEHCIGWMSTSTDQGICSWAHCNMNSASKRYLLAYCLYQLVDQVCYRNHQPRGWAFNVFNITNDVDEQTLAIYTFELEGLLINCLFQYLLHILLHCYLLHFWAWGVALYVPFIYLVSQKNCFLGIIPKPVDPTCEFRPNLGIKM